ncbi:TRAP transporter fused permease subunit [Rhizobium sp. L1K21]|uniref:TRAP transporter permease n=1 Tax=Rhizobium sp. L1K21 TaxID=2954933 RepID=UPI002091FEEF|nr:TRAP transporter fused permease subunit [Rhizobium sp. L1K21]MCO6185355.1 TRAP transporter fused permease subunit [Rhizobium sp. L1K21]
MMKRVSKSLLNLYLAVLFVAGIAWIINLPERLGVSLIQYEWLATYLGVAVAAVHLAYPYGKKTAWLDIAVGLLGLAAWTWSAVHTEAWMFSITGKSPDKIIPGAIALIALMEGLRKSCGLSITILVWAMIVYGLFGYHLPQPVQANYTNLNSLIYYLYTDSNAVVGAILSIVATLVLAFLVFGRMLDVSGATRFFTDICLAFIGHRRGGPAKVAVVASGLFGSVSSSPVGNIMSTGVVTIPLMQKSGFRAYQAAAIEAVASTGGQIAPPVMGATAFLIAEFLQISYVDVVKAALIPALFYYLCLFFHVDALARREKVVGLSKADLPSALAVLRTGWIFLFPLAWLIYLLFWAGTQPAMAALWSALVLLAFALVKGRFLNLEDWKQLVLEGGANMLPILMIAGGAGIVVGVMNVSGLAQSLSFLLTQVGESYGLFTVLFLTAVLCVILGMGMPSTAIYVVLATLIGPTLTELGVPPLASHLFIFYFGVMSFLTPPVAVASYVAAGLAKTSMWLTSALALRAALAAFVLPFIWCYRPEILLMGSPIDIALVSITTLIALWLYAEASAAVSFAMRAGLTGICAIMLLVPVVTGPQSPWIFATAVVGAILVFLVRRSEPETLNTSRESA